MSCFKNVNELDVREHIRILLYGEPGVGKSTLALSAPNPVLFDFDGGVQRIHIRHRVPTLQIKSWDDVKPALEEIKTTPSIETIVVDTAGKMLDYMEMHIIKNDSRLGKRDGSLTLQGFGVRKKMFVDFLKEVSFMDKNIIFVAHEREEKQGDVVKKRPEIGGSSAGDLTKEMDLVGYVRTLGKDRTITFDPNECYYAKNTCNLPENIKIPTIIDKKNNVVGENNLLSQIINSYHEKQKQDNLIIGEYNQQIEDLTNKIKNINNKDEADMFVSTMEELKEQNKLILDSKIKIGKLYTQRLKELGIK